MAKLTFLEFFSVTEEDMYFLWRMFMEFGMTNGEAPHRSKGNHIFLQALCQNHSVEWATWEDKLTPILKKIIEWEYPQFMVQNKNYEK